MLKIINTNNISRRPDKIRHSFGFNNPNAAGIFLACIVICLVIIRFEKIKWFDIIFAVVGTSVVAFVIDSRGSLLFLLTFFITVFALRKIKCLFYKSEYKFIFSSVPFITFGGSVFMALCYNSNNKFWQILNKFSSLRVYYISEAIRFNLFKNDTPLPKCVDNSYIAIMAENGIIILAIILILYSILLAKLWKQKAIPEIAVTIAFLVYFMVENLMLSCLNFSVIFIISVILFDSKEPLFVNKG